MTATCACGNASIVVDAAPSMHGVCHCENCKRRTGSAFGISAYFDRSAVVETGGETKAYCFTHSSGQHEQARHFCTNCGTTLFWFVSTLPTRSASPVAASRARRCRIRLIPSLTQSANAMFPCRRNGRFGRKFHAVCERPVPRGPPEPPSPRATPPSPPSTTPCRSHSESARHRFRPSCKRR